MVSVTEDQNTAEQVFQSFKEVADGKVCFHFTYKSVVSFLFLKLMPFYSHTLPSLTSDTRSFQTKSLNTWSRQCLNMKALTFLRTETCPSSTTSASWKR
jgi:hypothetical protein